ncbi:hypothetical protein V7x_22820 [Crateriforma conspicua]|uniref:Uncharacterized protein n=1 Tax=Crateriforma conspicua TaxID=2527996 RepID=A0A5C6FW99_9PLAN|nr:hypothetical protein [Crateriforma conspicua]TWU66711.1 hypothetical protein V7x_22820 [Crateriforma conspicua]
MKKLPKKAICKWNKTTLEKALPILLQQADQAQYVCRKCGRIAADPKNLCKAIHRSDFDES